MNVAKTLIEEDVITALEKISKASTYTQEGVCYMGSDGLVYCAKCNTPLQKAFNFDGTVLNMPVMCKCESDEYDRQRMALDRDRHEVEVQKLQELGFHNQYYLACTFNKDDYANPEMSRIARIYVDRFDRFYAKGLGMLFQGSCGDGKTFMSACIGNALIDKEYSVYMTSISDLINLMTKDYGNHRQTLIDKLSAVDLLILDDLGTENILDSRKSNVIELTYKVIDSRYLSNKPMIVSTNLDILSLTSSNSLDLNLKRIFERILQRCKPYDFGTTNRRLSQSKSNNDTFRAILES